jgi:hypothetical protein
MDMVLVDWTRMGKTYCLAGVILQDGRPRVVRPLPGRQREAPVRNVGWPPFLVDGRSRWEVFELVGPSPAEPRPPHLEDVWVHSLRPRRDLAGPAQRRAILRATTTPPDQPLFGAPLTTSRATAYLAPGTGARSLAGAVVPALGIRFTASWREGVAEPDYRVSLALPGLEGRMLPVKDHVLLCQAEGAATDLDGRVRALHRAVGQMGEQVVVRLGLSRAFQAAPGRFEGVCWLMADGFFSLTDPQP